MYGGCDGSYGRVGGNVAGWLVAGNLDSFGSSRWSSLSVASGGVVSGVLWAADCAWSGSLMNSISNASRALPLLS